MQQAQSTPATSRGGILERLAKGHRDILLCVLDHTPPKTLMALAKTSRELRQLARNQIAVRFDVQKLLRRFFSDPRAFQLLQRETEAVVAGTAALGFFTETAYDHVLEVHVGQQFARRLWTFVQSEGFHFAPEVGQSGEMERAASEFKGRCQRGRVVDGVLRFKREERGKQEEVLLVVQRGCVHPLGLLQRSCTSECF